MFFEAWLAAREHEREVAGGLLYSHLLSPGKGKHQALLQWSHNILDRQVEDGPRPEPDEQEAEHFGKTLARFSSPSSYFREWGRLLVLMPGGPIERALYRVSPLVNEQYFFRIKEEDGSFRIWSADDEEVAQNMRDRINAKLGDQPGAFLVRDSEQHELTHICLYEEAAVPVA